MYFSYVNYIRNYGVVAKSSVFFSSKNAFNRENYERKWLKFKMLLFMQHISHLLPSHNKNKETIGHLNKKWEES